MPKRYCTICCKPLKSFTVTSDWPERQRHRKCFLEELRVRTLNEMMEQFKTDKNNELTSSISR